LQSAGTPHLLQVLLHTHDPVADQAPVGLDLRLAGTAQEAEAAALPLQMGPGPHEPAALVFEMRELDLHGALLGARALPEDVEDEAGPVDDLAFPGPLQVPLLHGAELRIDNSDGDVFRLDRLSDGLDLPLAHQRRRTPGPQRRDGSVHHHQSDRRGQTHRFGQLGVRRAGCVLPEWLFPWQDDRRAGWRRGSLSRCYRQNLPPALRLFRLCWRQKAGSGLPASRC